MWRASDLQRIATFPSAAADDDAQIAFSPDQETIAVVEPSWAGVVSARTGARIRPFSPATLAKSAADGRIGWSADGAYVAFVDAAVGDLQIWEASTGKRFGVDHGVKGTDVRIVSSPKGGHLAVHVSGGEHRIWDMNRKSVRPVPNALSFAFFVDEESYVVSSTTSHQIEVRRVATDETVRTINMPEVDSIALTGSTDGRWIAYRDGPSAHVVRLADGASVDVGAVKIAGVRHALVRRADGAYDGPKEAEPCLIQAGVAAPNRVPGLFADLVKP
jgi:hypothetical protein